MAADRILFVGWDRPITGREAAGMESFSKFMTYLGRQQSSGRIESFEPVMLDPSGGTLNGFVVIRGAYNNLAAMTNEDEWRTLFTEASYTMKGMSVITGNIGQGLQQTMARYAKVITK